MCTPPISGTPNRLALFSRQSDEALKSYGENDFAIQLKILCVDITTLKIRVEIQEIYAFYSGLYFL